MAASIALLVLSPLPGVRRAADVPAVDV
jgi:hypothetical protein